MPANFNYDDVTKRLRESPTNITCSELKKMLEDLGFIVTKGTKGNHHRFKHPQIPEFFGGKFDGGHGPKIKPVYSKDVLSILEEYEMQLKPEQGEKK